MNGGPAGLWPVMARELSAAAHRRRLAIVQILALLTTAGSAWVSAGLMHHVFGEVYLQGDEPFGREVLMFALNMLCMMLGFMAPALTATAISEERERRTLDLLLCTRLRPQDIVLGKLAAGLIQGGILVTASFPAAAFAWLWGGVPLAHLALAYLMVMVLVVLLLALGLFSSSRAVATRSAVGQAYGIGMALLVPVFAPLVGLSFQYAQGKQDAMVPGVVGMMLLTGLWVTVACVLAAITGISPVSRDPAPAARFNLAFMIGSACVAAAAAGTFLDPKAQPVVAAVLYGLPALGLLVCAVLFATEDPPVRKEGMAPWLLRSGPWSGLGWLLVGALLLGALVPSLGARQAPAPWLSASTATALVPFFASCAGVSTLMRLTGFRRAGRRLMALGIILLTLGGQLMVAFLLGHLSLTLAPAWMFLWLHPGIFISATAPGSTGQALGPFGLDMTAAFVLGHLVIAGVSIFVGHLFGKPSPRLD